jgi:hypothetical protein
MIDPMSHDGCALCGEPVEPDYVPPNGADQARCNGRPAHNECMVREALGGIGHLEDHAHWCGQMGDPDGGRTYRESAREVMAWVQRHGTVSEVADAVADRDACSR